MRKNISKSACLMLLFNPLHPYNILVRIKQTKVGITGAGGFVGKELASYLITHGFMVSRFTSRKNIGDLIFLDMMEEKCMESRFAEIDVLIHLAWLGSDRKNRNIKEFQETNVSLAKNLAKAIKVTNLRHVIGIGSQDELQNGEQPWNDNSDMSPSSEYSKAKIEVYNILGEFSNNFTWARLFSVYGKYDPREWIFTNAIKSIRNNSPVQFGECSKPWSLTHVRDVSSAFEMLITNATSGKVNISNLEAPTLKDHLELLQSLSFKNLFSFKKNDLEQREISRTPGILESLGWYPKVDRKEAFLELII